MSKLNHFTFRLDRVAGLILLAVFLLLSGCSTYTVFEEQPNSYVYAPVEAEAQEPKLVSSGSLFMSHGGLNLYEDRRAYRAGDIITVNLNERTVSSKSSETSVSKDSATNLALTQILGGGAGGIPTDFSAGRSFDGSGETDQQNSLTGSIAVTVAGTLPNGLLEIKGEKWMTLTTGKEYIRLRGLIRPEDISSSNTISSTKIADARISYSGTGELIEANRQGWISRFFNSQLWPF